MKKRAESGDYDWGLFHHRWAVPVVAALETAGGGAKFVTLQMRLGVARDSLKRTLAALTVARQVKRNPGYGHPMRPEYVLTARGRARSADCGRLCELVERLGLPESVWNKWSLPVVYAISQADGRFNAIRDGLGSITPRALALALRDVEQAGLVTRTIVDDYPPRAEYRLTRHGKVLAEPVARLRLARR